MGSQQKPEIPKAPEASKEFQKGLQVWTKYLPKMLKTEYASRRQWDPKFIEQALGLQHRYDPQLAGEQLAALQRRDPEWDALHAGLGAKISQALEQGYIDPDRAAAYTALGRQVTGDTLRGGTADPETLRQMTQAILSRSPTLSYGEAQDMAAAVYTGQRSQALKAQRQVAANQFLGQQSERGQTLAQAGSFLSSPTRTQMINQVGGVTPPSAFRYENPNAGYMNQQFALQNYQNQLAYSQMSGGGSSNPWMNALQGASTGASMGSVGGVYGAAGGAITGAVAGGLGYPQFSDSRWKQNISRTGSTTKDGIPIVEYDDAHGRRMRGVLAQDVAKKRPDAVYHFMNGRLGVFYSRLGIELEEV